MVLRFSVNYGWPLGSWSTHPCLCYWYWVLWKQCVFVNPLQHISRLHIFGRDLQILNSMRVLESNSYHPRQLLVTTFFRGFFFAYNPLTWKNNSSHSKVKICSIIPLNYYIIMLLLRCAPQKNTTFLTSLIWPFLEGQIAAQCLQMERSQIAENSWGGGKARVQQVRRYEMN